jgi:hypothetical protein
MVVQAKPHDDLTEGDSIEKTYWNNLTVESDLVDSRQYFVATEDLPSLCHAEYQPLETLILSMAEQLKGDHQLLLDRDQDE